MSLSPNDVNKLTYALNAGYQLLQMQAELEAMKIENSQRTIDGKPIAHGSDEFYNLQNAVIEQQRTAFY